MRPLHAEELRALGNRISKAAAREDELAGEVSHAKAALLPLQLQLCLRAYAKCMALLR